MPRKKRDYAAEYKRRIASASKRGIPKSVARGHPAKGFVSVTVAKRFGITDYSSDTLNEQLHRAAQIDAQGRFGEVPRRQKGELPAQYEFRLEDLSAGQSRLNWTDEGEFIRAITGLGLTEREAYTLWFSP